jgi:hypothetical protein
MKKRLLVTATSVEENQLVLSIEDTLTHNEATELQATGSMLVDSDQLALIYILENDEDFVYLAISKDHWPNLKNAIENHMDISLHMETDEGKNHTILLDNIVDEFTYLKDNIADNANYGEEMVEKFTEVFITS